ncbi:MAG: hypothetical protein H6734_08835 [Alphaproteobacteria bacterium]|nr:hypothetical protein [Alphaproteobacteria bacterium]
MYRVRHPLRSGLVATTSVLGVTSALLLAQIPAARKGFYGTDDYNQLKRYQYRNNTLLVGGIRGLGLTVGSGALTGLWWDR